MGLGEVGLLNVKIEFGVNDLDFLRIVIRGSSFRLLRSSYSLEEYNKPTTDITERLILLSVLLP